MRQNRTAQASFTVPSYFFWPHTPSFAYHLNIDGEAKTKITTNKGGHMSRKIVVGYDGSEASRRALDFAVSRAAVLGDSIVIAHVLEWSPYSFLTQEELQERHQRRKEELQRAEDVLIQPVVKQVEAEGIPVTTAMRYGHIAETLCKIAQDEGAALIFIGRMGESGFASRIFGSVAGTLAQVAPVPVTIVP